MKRNKKVDKVKLQALNALTLDPIQESGKAKEAYYPTGFYATKDGVGMLMSNNTAKEYKWKSAKSWVRKK